MNLTEALAIVVIISVAVAIGILVFASSINAASMQQSEILKDINANQTTIRPVVLGTKEAWPFGTKCIVDIEGERKLVPAGAECLYVAGEHIPLVRHYYTEKAFDYVLVKGNSTE